MFERTFVENGAVSRRPFTMAVSLLSQCLLVCLGALIPLLYTNALPLRGWVSQSLGGLPREPQSARQPKGRAPRRFETESLPRSTTIPEKAALITEESDLLPAADVSQNNLGAGVPGGVLGSAGLGGNGFAELLARPPAPQDAERSEVEVSGEPMEIGGEVQAAKLLRRVTPVYPSLARQARVGGLVRLRAIISEDGSVRRLEVLSGHPLLVGSAVEAGQALGSTSRRC